MNKKDGVGEICDAEVQTRKDIALKGVLFFPFFFSRRSGSGRWERLSLVKRNGGWYGTVWYGKGWAG